MRKTATKRADDIHVIKYRVQLQHTLLKIMGPLTFNCFMHIVESVQKNEDEV